MAEVMERFGLVSIHALVRVRLPISVPTLVSESFNPRTRESATGTWKGRRHDSLFQSTHS